MRTKIRPVKGTRDFYPEDMRMRTWLYQTIRRVSESFGYQEYEGPFLETLDLFAAKSGEELVKKQAFLFQDRGGNWITLRPELTPTLARMVAERQGSLTFPLRWWSFGPMWRYEQPGKGRGREFFQWNIDLIGAQSPEADAELVAVGAIFLKEIGLKPEEVQILVNNRRLLDSELAALGIPQDQRQTVSKFIDRRDKMQREEWAKYSQEIGLEQSQFEKLVAMIENVDLWKKSEELKRFFTAVETLGVSSYVRFAPHIVRGLDYYTGTVFEAWDQDGEFRSILGGGRYENLVSDVGGKPVTGIGFAMGDMVITEVLSKFGRIPSADKLSPSQVLVTVFDEQLMLPSLQLAMELRQSGLNVASYPDVDKLSKQLKYADKIGAHIVVILGPDEVANGLATVKDLRRSKQETVARSELAQTIRQMLLNN